jgi:hypothetical protein
VAASRGREFATLRWVDWFNHRRLLEPIGYLPPAEYEAQYYEQLRCGGSIAQPLEAGALGGTFGAAPLSLTQAADRLQGSL